MRVTVIYKTNKEAKVWHQVRHVVEGRHFVILVFDDGRLHLKVDRILEIHALEEVEAGVIPVHAEVVENKDAVAEG